MVLIYEKQLEISHNILHSDSKSISELNHCKKSNHLYENALTLPNYEIITVAICLSILFHLTIRVHRS